MASVMLITLAVSRIDTLRGCIPPQVVDIGSHLSRLFEQWMRIPGRGVSPSVYQSKKLIDDVNMLLSMILE